MLTTRARRAAVTLIAAGATMLASGVSVADAGDAAKKQEAAAKSAEAKRANAAAGVLSAALEAGDGAIPAALLEQAHAIAVFPDVVKAAVLAGGKYGRGLVAERNADGEWSAPAFVTVGGASFGFQAGIESVDLVLVFTDENALSALFEDGIKLGATAEVAAGPIGRSAQMGTNATFETPIYAYSRSKGLFAGVSLLGAVVKPDVDANAAVYGADASTIEAILAGSVKAPEHVRPFVAMLPSRDMSSDESTSAG